MASSSPYDLNSGMRCVKYMLLIINFMFLLTSILLILVGTTIQTIFGDFRLFLDDHFFSPPAILIAVGGIMLLVSFFGCMGAMKESTMLINMYGIFLFIVFVLEVSAAIAAFLLQGQVKTMLVKSMNHSLNHYQDNEYTKRGVDFMQSQLECCGVHDPSDWKNIQTTLPLSCCEYYEPKRCISHHRSGCLRKMNFLISQSAMLIATGATTVAFVQLLGVLSAFMLAKTIRRNKSIREARRWQLQQSLGILVPGGKNLQDSGYTKLEKTSENNPEPVTYTANSPSVN